MSSRRGHEIIPGARRLIESLRDLGYDFVQAVADLVDNSIEAGATEVRIRLEFEGDDTWVRISDNGHGMTPAELREAMRYGAERDYDAEDLGKFGLGLKTASLSQCQRLTVASRSNKGRGQLAAYSWDLEHIRKTNRWEILPIQRHQLGPNVLGNLKSTHGTVVLWQRLDRILGYKHPYGESAHKRLLQMCRGLEDHLAMVFHRFLSGKTSRRKLQIYVNDNPLKPWDPFCLAEPKTKILEPVKLEVEHEGIKGYVVVEPYILPHQDDFSSMDAHRKASGPASWNQQQGFYIYRADRMIQSGGWSNLRSPDEHTKLARVAVRFPPHLDEAFKINVAKMRVQLPAPLRDAIRDTVTSVTKRARDIYDRKESKARAAQLASPVLMAGTAVHEHRAALPETGTAPAILPASGPTAPRLFQGTLLSFDEWSIKILSVATPRERPAIKAVLARLRDGIAS